MLLNAALIDYSLVTENNRGDLVDRHKLRRQRDRWGRAESESNTTANLKDPIWGIYYDGRDDQTLISCNGGKTRKEKQSHDVIVAEPGNKYVDHITPLSGRSEDIAAEILNVMAETGAEPVVIGSDGTPVNTGANGGVNRRVEIGLGRPLQQAICGIHMNELTLRYVFLSIDGQTSSPSSYKGDLGKQISKDVIQLPLHPFLFNQCQGWSKPFHLKYRIPSVMIKSICARFAWRCRKARKNLKTRC